MQHYYALITSLTLLFSAHIYYKLINLPEYIDICSFLMVITIQFYWIGKFHKRYSLLEIINYLLCPASILAGPPIPTDTFVARMRYLMEGRDSQRVDQVTGNVPYIDTPVVHFYSDSQVIKNRNSFNGDRVEIPEMSTFNVSQQKKPKDIQSSGFL